MKLDPWNPVRVAANVTAFRCTHCGATEGPKREMTVPGFMRKLRAFERAHNRCAPAARLENAGNVTTTILKRFRLRAAAA